MCQLNFGWRERSVKRVGKRKTASTSSFLDDNRRYSKGKCHAIALGILIAGFPTSVRAHPHVIHTCLGRAYDVGISVDIRIDRRTAIDLFEVTDVGSGDSIV